MQATTSGQYALLGQDGRTHRVWLERGETVELPLKTQNPAAASANRCVRTDLTKNG